MAAAPNNKYTGDPISTELSHLERHDFTKHASHDARDMARLGRVQVVQREFKPIQLAGFTITLAATWPYVITTTPLSLLNGGPAGAIWNSIGLCLFMSTVVVSLAHIASMAPASGGPYHWVSEFAPPKQQRLLSYLVGWLDMLAWQAGTAATAYFFATAFLGLLALCDSSFIIRTWHITITSIVGAFLAIPANLFVRRLAWVEGLLFILLTMGFFAFGIVLLVFGPKENTKEVFFNFQDNAGWGNQGLATLLGLLPVFIVIAGSDSTCHMAEETQGAARKVPAVMIGSMVFNYTTTIVMTIIVMVVSTGYSEAVATHTGQVGIAILFNATQSKTATIVLTVVLTIIFFFGLVNQMTVTSRMTWAFARDKGIPYHDYFARISIRWNMPLWSTLLTFAITCLFSFLPLASTITLNILASLSLIGLSSAYLITILTVFKKRIYKEGKHFPVAHLYLPLWVLNVINIVALLTLTLVIVILFFPSAPRPTAASMNWIIVLLPGVLILSALYFYLVARHEYGGPVALVQDLGVDSIVSTVDDHKHS